MTPSIEAVLEIWKQTGRTHMIPIAGRSMLPLIHDGDQVLVTHNLADVRRGDIVVFRQGERLIAHRVLGIDSDAAEVSFLTKGDNAAGCDPPVSANEIVGRVLSIKRGSRQMTLDTPLWRRLGWLIAICMLGWVKLYRWGWRLAKRNRRAVGSNYLTAFPGRVVRFLPRLALIIIQTAAGRWTG